MALRFVYVPVPVPPYYFGVPVHFNYNRGLNIKQKQKNIVAIHEEYLKENPDKHVLEISSKSLQPEGVLLSAFNLKKDNYSVEVLYQGGKVFENGGPFTDLYEGTSRAAKKDERLKNSGRLVSFYYAGEMLPLNPIEAFYNWLYITALMENKELSEQVLKYNGFTDIEFNPAKAINCQAKAAAIYHSLANLGLLDKVKDYHEFIKLFKKTEESELEKQQENITSG